MGGIRRIYIFMNCERDNISLRFNNKEKGHICKLKYTWVKASNIYMKQNFVNVI